MAGGFLEPIMLASEKEGLAGAGSGRLPREGRKGLRLQEGEVREALGKGRSLGVWFRGLLLQEFRVRKRQDGWDMVT